MKIPGFQCIHKIQYNPGDNFLVESCKFCQPGEYITVFSGKSSKFGKQLSKSVTKINIKKHCYLAQKIWDHSGGGGGGQWRKMANNGEKWRKKNGDGEFGFFICQIRHFSPIFDFGISDLTDF